jgi:hypothetical protein
VSVYDVGPEVEHWFVDPVHGDDKNDGRGTVDAPRPLRSWGRLAELLQVVSKPTVIHAMGHARPGDVCVLPRVVGRGEVCVRGWRGGERVNLPRFEAPVHEQSGHAAAAQHVRCMRCGSTLAVWRTGSRGTLTAGTLRDLAVAHGCGSSGTRVQDVEILGVSEAQAKRLEKRLEAALWVRR